MIEKIETLHPLVLPLLTVVIILFAAMLVDWLLKRIVLVAVRRIAKASATTWDDELVRHNVFGRLVHVVPAMIVFSGAGFVPDLPESALQLIRNIAMGYIILVLTLAMTSLLSAANAIYAATDAAKHRPLKGFIQLLQIVVWVFGGILIIAAVIDRSPLLLLSGFGAMTAILLLIFKDTILSLVASVQLTAQDMVRVGDWIEMPQYGADGDVVDVQLHTIKVQNWDKTITTIPTHKLISDSFRNWRGMQDTGARRIKRALTIDVSSIRFQESDEIDRFRQFVLLKDYIDHKEQELRDYNDGLPDKTNEAFNTRRLTNIGTFRAYIYNYLKHHPSIDTRMTLIVRQLAPGPEGLPLEIYCFTNTTVWADYEGIQSDLFDHMLAMVAEFGLRLYQKPAGSDIADIRDAADLP